MEELCKSSFGYKLEDEIRQKHGYFHCDYTTVQLDQGILNDNRISLTDCRVKEHFQTPHTSEMPRNEVCYQFAKSRQTSNLPRSHICQGLATDFLCCKGRWADIYFECENSLTYPGYRGFHMQAAQDLSDLSLWIKVNGKWQRKAFRIPSGDCRPTLKPHPRPFQGPYGY